MSCMMASNLIVALSCGCLLFKTHTFEQGVLSEFLLHGNGGFLKVPFFSPGLAFVEKGGLTAFCVYLRKPYAYASDEAGGVDLLIEEPVEFGGYEQRGVRGSVKRHGASVMGRLFGVLAGGRIGSAALRMGAIGVAHEKGDAIGQ